MKCLKIIFKISAFLLLCYYINSVFSILLVNTSSWSRYAIVGMYNESENIDILCLGSSHCFHSIQPLILDEYTEQYSYNLGTGSQRMNSAYALLVEANKTNEISTVYLECFYELWNNDGIIAGKHEDITDISETINVADYMRFSLNKIEYLLEATDSKYYANTFIPARRHWGKIFDISYIIENIQRQLESNTESEESLNSRGFSSSLTQSKVEGDFIVMGEFIPLSSEWIGGDYLEDLYQIAEYCEENSIELILYSAPMPNFYILRQGGSYDDYVNRMEDIAEEIGSQYYDFNLCRTEYLNLEDGDFADDNHLNINGSTEFSHLFGDFFYGDLNCSEDIFYDSYAEKLSSMEERVFGLVIEPFEENRENKEYVIRPVTNLEEDNSRITYTIINHVEQISEEERVEVESEILQEESNNAWIELPLDQMGSIEIYVYLDGEETNHVTFEY